MKKNAKPKLPSPFTAQEYGPAPGWIVVVNGECFASFGYGADGEAKKFAEKCNVAYQMGLRDGQRESLFAETGAP